MYATSSRSVTFWKNRSRRELPRGRDELGTQVGAEHHEGEACLTVEYLGDLPPAALDVAERHDRDRGAQDEDPHHDERDGKIGGSS